MEQVDEHEPLVVQAVAQQRPVLGQVGDAARGLHLDDDPAPVPLQAQVAELQAVDGREPPARDVDPVVGTRPPGHGHAGEVAQLLEQAGDGRGLRRGLEGDPRGRRRRQVDGVPAPDLHREAPPVPRHVLVRQGRQRRPRGGRHPEARERVEDVILGGAARDHDRERPAQGVLEQHPPADEALRRVPGCRHRQATVEVVEHDLRVDLHDERSGLVRVLEAGRHGGVHLGDPGQEGERLLDGGHGATRGIVEAVQDQRGAGRGGHDGRPTAVAQEPAGGDVTGAAALGALLLEPDWDVHGDAVRAQGQHGREVRHDGDRHGTRVPLRVDVARGHHPAGPAGVHPHRTQPLHARMVDRAAGGGGAVRPATTSAAHGVQCAAHRGRRAGRRAGP